MRFTLSMIALLAFATSIGYAEQADPHPCAAMKKACKAAGFYYGGHKKGPNKGLKVDCMKPLLSGQSVPGVNVNPADAAACKAKRAVNR